MNSTIAAALTAATTTTTTSTSAFTADTKPNSNGAYAGQIFIPVNIDPDAITDIFNKWQNTLYFLPFDFQETLRVYNVSYYYVPFYVFSASSETNYVGRVFSADKGKQKICDGSFANQYDKVFSCATSSVSIEGNQDWLLSLMNNNKWVLEFGRPASAHSPIATASEHRNDPNNNNSNALQRYRHEKFEILPTEDYNLIWDRESKKIVTREKIFCESNLVSTRVQIMSTKTTFKDFTYQLVYYPIVVLSYQYKEKMYTFSVDCSLGSTIGERPYGIDVVGSVQTFMTGAFRKITTSAKFVQQMFKVNDNSNMNFDLTF